MHNSRGVTKTVQVQIRVSQDLFAALTATAAAAGLSLSDVARHALQVAMGVWRREGGIMFPVEVEVANARDAESA